MKGSENVEGAAARSGPVRLLTFNIAHGRGLALYQGFVSPQRMQRNLGRIAALMRRLKVDLALLQEIDFDSHWSARMNQLTHLREAARFPHAVEGVNNRREGRLPLRYGNALLSRFPVEGWENVPFGESTLGEKGFLYCELLVRGRLLPVINLHLDFRSKRARITQVDRVMDFIEGKIEAAERHTHTLPLICGDFNARSTKDTDAVAVLLQRILEHHEYSLHPPPRVKTFPSQLPQRSLDYVFLPRPMVKRHCHAVRSHLSDHRPVFLEFDWP